MKQIVLQGLLHCKTMGQNILNREETRSLPGCFATSLLATVLHSLLLVGAWTATYAGVESPLAAQSEKPADSNREYTVKAAFLLQFGRYVQWPANAFADKDSPLVIGVLGPDPFGRVFDEVARTKRIDGRPVLIRRFTSMEEYQPCHILFISASAGPAQTALAIEKLKNQPVLLVGEEPGFAEHGGAINFFLEESKIRFEISLAASKREQPKISSTLLSLAKIVGHQ